MVYSANYFVYSSSMMTSSPDLKHVRQVVAVAHEYDALMGLVSIIMGAGFLLGAATGSPAVWVLVGSLAGLASMHWYYQRFGFVRMRSDRMVRYVAGIVLGVVVVGAAVGLDVRMTVPVSLTLLAAALTLGVGEFLMLRRMGLTPVHWGSFAVLVLAAFAPLVGVGADGPRSPFVLVVIGVVLIAIGVTDHLRLVKIMGSEPEGFDERP